MKISYNWLKEFIPTLPAPEQLSTILTSIGLEVEGVEEFEEIKGNLAGLVAGEILTCRDHPQADKLKVTEVDTGKGNILQIVCGATNVIVGKKVVVAPAGSTIFPLNGGPVTISSTKIRGVESNGMLCAEDEIGIGDNHSGIMILPDGIEKGSAVADWFTPVNDRIFEIGLTPNRIDAMSHIGVARDVCAYLSHHTKKKVTVSPSGKKFSADNFSLPVKVTIENTEGCERYAGVSIAGIKVGPSPKWMQLKLKSIGLRPVNNIVDITNFILHETGQPLHAFDLDLVTGNQVIVKNLPAGTPFITLDEKQRELNATDLMICNGNSEPMCFAGVFGGLQSGVKSSTTHIFLESAWFNPVLIRKTSLRHNLRTDAALRFEKGVDISETTEALKKAAMLIKELAGGEIASGIIDVYPFPKPPTRVTLHNPYLRKISGKDYHRDEVRNILESLGFQIESENTESLTVAVPFSKPDVTLPADIVEEIIRIDGFNNIEIPSAITITPALENNILETSYKENVSNFLTGAGFSEIFTNSVTNSKYYDDTTLKNSVKILNSLSSDLTVMRPSLLESGLETIVYNLNRKNNSLLFFEFGNTYRIQDTANYIETEHLCLYLTGNKKSFGWKEKPVDSDIYFLKGACESILKLCRVNNFKYVISQAKHFEWCLNVYVDENPIGEMGIVTKNILQKFDIRQPVLYADLCWKAILQVAKNITVFNEIPKFPSVHRDLSIVVPKNTGYQQIEDVVRTLEVKKLKGVKLFDVFESEKLGQDKKAFAITLTFIDTEKTLTDKEIDGWMNTIIASYKKELGAEIRS